MKELTESDKKKIGLAIRLKRDEIGMTQKEIAARLGVSYQAIQNWEAGKSLPRAARLEALCNALGISSHELFAKAKPSHGDFFKAGMKIGETGFKEFVKAYRDPRQYISEEPLSDHLTAIETWDDSTPLREDEVALPFFTEVEAAAGGGAAHIQENHGPKLRFSKSTLQRLGVMEEHAACIRVKGNSMEPVIPDGATVGIDTAVTTPVDGKKFAIDHDGMLRVKMLYRLPGGGLRLRSYNTTEHPDENYSAEEFKQHIRILGRVFWWSVLDP